MVFWVFGDFGLGFGDFGVCFGDFGKCVFGGFAVFAVFC